MNNSANRLEILQARIHQYGMRFPVAKIAKVTGLDKGYVSAVLNGKKPISDNFWSTFEEKFPEKENGHGAQMSTDQLLPLGNIKITVADYIRRIEQFNDTLSNAINQGLIEIKANLKDISGDLDAIETRQRADDTVILKSLERIEKVEPGTFSKEADTLVDASSLAEGQVDNSLSSDKKSN